MNIENEKKQERMNYLWGKVRAYVRGSNFLRRMRTSTDLKSRKSLRGITAKK